MTHPNTGITPPHGSYVRYQNYGCRCDKCRNAQYRYVKALKHEWKHGTKRLIAATGTQRRIRALMALGWPKHEIGQRMGVVEQTVDQILDKNRQRVRKSTAAAVATVYDELCMTAGPSERTRAHAARKGYAPPLAYDDIDDSTTPATTSSRSSSTRRTDDSIDEVVIDKLLRGENIYATKAEQEETVRRIMADPERTLADFAKQTHLNVGSIAERINTRNRRAGMLADAERISA